MKEKTSKFPRFAFLLAVILLCLALRDFLQSTPSVDRAMKQHIAADPTALPEGLARMEEVFPSAPKWNDGTRGNPFYPWVPPAAIQKNLPIIQPDITLPKPKAVPIALPEKPKPKGVDATPPQSPVTYHGLVQTEGSKEPKVLLQNRKDGKFFTLVRGESGNGVTVLSITHKSVKIRTEGGKEFEVPSGEK